MVVKVVQVPANADLVIEHRILEEAGLRDHLQIVAKEGQIHILSVEETEAERTLEELAGCLGEEPATAYDFGLKIGGFYEAR